MPRPVVVYLVSNLPDPAVAKRVEMIQDGGADVFVAGYTRADHPPDPKARLGFFSFGAVSDGQFVRRAFRSLGDARSWALWRAMPKHFDVVIARNLEMLAIGLRLARGKPNVRVVYECLDIHRLMLRQDILGSAMRGVERRLCRSVDLIVTSSPAFVTNYFHKVARLTTPIRIVENKVSLHAPAALPRTEAPAAPWKLGWFGALRCSRSLGILSAVASRTKNVEIELRGRPSLTEIPHFHAMLAKTDHLAFHGPYANPDDLPAIYGPMHFCWAIDFYDEHANAEWLLPHRLYEGGLYGAVPIARAGTATARYLRAADIGIVLEEVTPDALVHFFDTLTPDAYAALSAQMRKAGRDFWTTTLADCHAFVEALTGTQLEVAT